MKDILEAFQIFAKYSDDNYPTGCEHDIMYVYVNPEIISLPDTERLEELGFSVNENDGCFVSYRFGSA